ncbi:putative serine/threonine-protein kinase [Sesbania bispinosa]|nr:putative serine/threonine-protein kinase [Sesbania bispinosa]
MRSSGAAEGLAEGRHDDSVRTVTPPRRWLRPVVTGQEGARQRRGQRLSVVAYALNLVKNTGCQLWSKGTRFTKGSQGSLKRVYFLKQKGNKLWILLITGVEAVVAALASCYLCYVLRRKYKVEGRKRFHHRKHVFGAMFQMTLVSNTFSGSIVDAKEFIVGSLMGRQEGNANSQKKVSLMSAALHPFLAYAWKPNHKRQKENEQLDKDNKNMIEEKWNRSKSDDGLDDFHQSKRREGGKVSYYNDVTVSHII